MATEPNLPPDTTPPTREDQLLEALQALDMMRSNEMLLAYRTMAEPRHYEAVIEMMRTARGAQEPDADEERKFRKLVELLNTREPRVVTAETLTKALRNLAKRTRAPLEDAYAKAAKMCITHCADIRPEHFELLWKIKDKKQQMRLAEEMIGAAPRELIAPRPGSPEPFLGHNAIGWDNFIKDELIAPYSMDDGFTMLIKAGQLASLVHADVSPDVLYTQFLRMLKIENPQSAKENTEVNRTYTGAILKTLRAMENQEKDGGDSARFFLWRVMRYKFAELETNNELHLPELIAKAYLPECPTTRTGWQYPDVRRGIGSRYNEIGGSSGFSR